MKNLFIIFNRLESHPNFNDISLSNETCNSFMCDFNKNYDVINGFAEVFHHFHRLRPNKNIIENSFSTKDGFNEKVKNSEILFIHVTNNIEKWNNDFQVKFEEYVSNFGKVHISYHKADVDNGKHTKVENFIKNKKIPYKSENKYHHEYEMCGNEKLYGYLAKAIIDNKGCFTEEAHNNTVEKLISFFKPDEEISKNQLLNKKLTFLHKLLGNQINDSQIEEELKRFKYEKKFNKDSKHNSIIAIRDEILKDF